MQNGAKSPSLLWQVRRDAPPVDVGNSVPEVGVCVEIVVAVRLGGAALIVVTTPLTVVRTGVIVAIGNPLASTVIQGSRADSVTERD
jgi:hypothetical protein